MVDQARHVHNLHRLLDITRQMAATTDLTQLLGTIVGAARAVLDCERATIFLYDREKDELYSRVATGDEAIRFPADRGIAGAAARERRVVNVPDAYADPRFNREIDRQTGFHTRNLLTFPLENLDGDLMGVLQALNKAGGPFSADDEELARVLSAQAGVALQRHVLLEEYAEKQRMAHNLELARKIQQRLFPKSNPTLAGYEIAGWNRCADETGGDFYDFIRLSDTRHAILLADATGHGIGAALVVAQCRSLARAMFAVTEDLPVIAATVNRLLTEDLTGDRFVTAFVGVLDSEQHRLSYIAAGQGPLMFVTRDGVEQRTACALPFAIDADFDCPPSVYDFAPGAAAVLLTDGFYETTDGFGTPFGEERVIGLIRHHSEISLVAMIEDLHAEVRRFSHDAPQADDLTAVLIRRNV